MYNYQSGPVSDQMALALFLTLFVYSVIPLGIALFRENYITKKKYTRACFGFNAIIMVLFFLFGGNGAAYLIWTTVFWAVGKRMLNNKGILKDNDYEEPSEPYYLSDIFKNSGEMNSKEDLQRTDNTPHNVKTNVSVSAEESVIVDRSQEYTVCPHCSTRQLSKRTVCYNCGVRFVDSEVLDQKCLEDD